MTHHSATAWIVLIALWVVSLSNPPMWAQDVELNVLRQQQRRQEKARGLATELVSSVLDIQLRQLKENQLEHLPIYSEIKSMRGNLDELVGREMKEVVRLLVAAQQGETADRLQKVHEARDVIREVVVALMAERQKLLKRLRIAHIAAQVRQLILLERDTLSQTKELPAVKFDKREQLTLDTIQDQRDITAIYFQLVDVLKDVSGWGGPIATGATEGLRVLTTAQVTQQLQVVATSLKQNEIETAITSQRNVIKGLMALLRVIQDTQGLIGADREAALKMVREMIAKQEELRETVRKDDLVEEAVKDEFAFEQRQIQQDLGTLAETLVDFPEVDPLVVQSRAAAAQAEAELFEGDKTGALLEQGQVVGSLAEIEEKLQRALESDSGAKTADELTEQVKQLERLDQALDQAVATQAKATEQAQANAAAALRAEQQVFKQLEAAQKLGDFTRGIESRLDDAKDAVEAAKKTTAQRQPEAAQARQQDTQRAEDVLRQAAAEVKAELADIKRRQLAVEVGELARAAEALERAAGAEREIARAAADAAQADGLSEDQAAALAKEQSLVNEVAEKIAEGVKKTAPKAAEQLAAAKPSAQETAQQLAAAEKQPGPDSKPAAAKAAVAAEKTAQQLDSAAAELRKAAGLAAQELAKQADEQLQPVAAARQAVEDVLAGLPENSIANLAQLEQASDDVAKARIEQMRASGRAPAAAAEEKVDAIAKTREDQQAANRAAAALARGAASTPLEASRKQDQVAEQAKQLAKSASPEVASMLNAAANAAAKAAQETLIGKPRDAEAARDAANAALDKALATAIREAREAAEQAPGAPNKDAQEDVGDLAGKAKATVGDRPADVADALSEAEQTSGAAEKALDAGNADAVAKSQKQTAENLDKAAEGLAKAINAAKKKQQAQLAMQSKETGQLADQAAMLDTGATAALRQAQRAAERMAATPAKENATDENTIDAGDLENTNKDVRRGLERAVASLAARQQQLQRDKDIAETLTQLAMQQQQARDEITKQANTLKQLADNKPSQPETDKAAVDARRQQQRAAAQALESASQQFAQAQRATGEGAVEVSGQDEVANRPIRQGLETAADLGKLPGKPLAESLAQADEPTGGTPAAEGALDSEGEGPMPPGTSGDGAANAAADGTAQNSPPGEASSETSPASTELGSGFVPDSPEVTAQQIAGSEALAEAARALAQASPSGQPSDSDAPPSEGEQSQSGPPAEAQDQTAKTSPTATTGGVSKDGEAQENQEAEDAPLELNPAAKGDTRSDKEEGESDAKMRNFQTQGWFAKLPPSLQKAIQAKARRRAPRGYEQRLKRYFESID
jgi:hypothetical protein